MNHAGKNRTGELARNVAVALRFKQSQGTPEMPQVEKEVLAPGYNRARGGNLHLASNARDEDFTHPGLYLRKALPDRVDVIERVIADGDRVGLLFRVTATHTGGFFGIPPTGKRLDVYEIAMLRLVNGQMVEGWFMMDEVELLRQMGAKLPARKDGRIVAPPLPDKGEEVDAVISRLEAKGTLSPQDRNKILAAASRSRSAKESRAAGHRHLRYGFTHLREYCKARGVAFDLDAAIPDRHDRIEVLMAEGDEVWMRFSTNGTHQGALCGLAPTGKRVGVHVAAILKFADGKITESWTFADEFGLLLQLGAPNLLLGSEEA
ncbi:MAG: ester cyclase [Betaproteobacteria bacterium]|nr:ester cyclase [Betaproteobacteria bacterium]